MQSIDDRRSAVFFLGSLVLYLCTIAGCWPQPPIARTEEYELSRQSVRQIWVKVSPERVPEIHLQLSETEATRLKVFARDHLGELIRFSLNGSVLNRRTFTSNAESVNCIWLPGCVTDKCHQEKLEFLMANLPGVEVTEAEHLPEACGD